MDSWISINFELFSEFSKRKKLNNLVGKIDIITCSSEKLFNYQRKILRIFLIACKRFIYGLTEGVVNISECKEGIYHIDENYSYVELIKIDGTKSIKL